MATILYLPLTELPFVDLGPNAFTVTNNGVSLDAVNGKFGNGARFTRSELDWLNLPDDPLWDFGSSNWTIHFWAYLHTFTNDDAFCGSLGDYPATTWGMNFALGTSAQGRVCRYYSGAYRIITTGQLVPLTTLVHLALVRDSTFVKIYLNGTLMTLGSWTHGGASVPGPGTRGFSVGSFWDDQQDQALDATLSEFIIDDTALWTSDFTPPSAPYAAAAPTISFNNITLSNIPI